MRIALCRAASPSPWRPRRLPVDGCASLRQPHRRRRSSRDPPPPIKRRKRPAHERARSSTPSSRAGYYERGQMDVALEELADRAEARSEQRQRSTTCTASSTRCSATTPKAEQQFPARARARARRLRRSATTGAGTCARTARPTRVDRRVRDRDAQSALQDARDRADQRRASAASRSATSPRADAVLPARAGALAQQRRRRRTTSRCSRTATGGCDEARALMRRRGAAAAPGARGAVPRHVHRAQARRPRRPKRSYVTQLRNRYPDSAEASAIADRRLRVSDAEPRRHRRTAIGSRRGSRRPAPLLRAAREALGLSIDAVAQQLKLAPRQVRALEDGDFAQLPGRTFVRGFMRNYARLVQLDPERCCGAARRRGDAGARSADAATDARGDGRAARASEPSSARWRGCDSRCGH